MADFRAAVLKTLVHEGGYSNNPVDPGGETYEGISRVNHPNWAGWLIIDAAKLLPGFPNRLEGNQALQELVITEYGRGYWTHFYSQISSQAIAEKLFDMGVLFDPHVAVKIFQRSIHVTPADGDFGPKTLASTNQVYPDAALMDFKANLVTHIFNIATKNPRVRIFLRGWATRINS